MGTGDSKMPSEKVKQLVDAKIAGKKVMMFSKTYCGFCAKAKRALQPFVGNELAAEDYEVMELDNDPDCDEIQDYLLHLTGGRSVPRVFINQKFFGGGDETARAASDGTLKKALQA